MGLAAGIEGQIAFYFTPRRPCLVSRIYGVFEPVNEDNASAAGHLMSTALTLADSGRFANVEEVSLALLALWPERAIDWHDLSCDPHFIATLKTRCQRASEAAQIADSAETRR